MIGKRKIPSADWERYRAMSKDERNVYWEEKKKFYKMRAQKATDVRLARKQQKEEALKKAFEESGGIEGAERLTKEVRELQVKSGSKSISEMQGAIDVLLTRYGIDPLEELLKLCKKGSTGISKKEKVTIYKFLMPYIHATKKSIDIQQDLKMSVSVTLQSYQGAPQKVMNFTGPAISDSEYDEFTDNLLENQKG